MIKTLIGCGVTLAKSAPLLRYTSGKINGTYIDYDIMISERDMETLEFKDSSGQLRDVRLIGRMKKRYQEEVVSVFGPGQDSLNEDHIVLYVPRRGAIKVLTSDGEVLDCADCLAHFYEVIGTEASNQGKRMLAGRVKLLFDKIRTGNTHAVK